MTDEDIMETRVAWEVKILSISDSEGRMSLDASQCLGEGYGWSEGGWNTKGLGRTIRAIRTVGREKNVHCYEKEERNQNKRDNHWKLKLWDVYNDVYRHR